MLFSHRNVEKRINGINLEKVDFEAEKLYIRQTITEANGKHLLNPIHKN